MSRSSGLRTAVVVLATAAALGTTAKGFDGNPGHGALGPRLRLAFTRGELLPFEARTVTTGSRELEVFLDGDPDPDRIEALGVTIRTRAGSIYTARAPLAAIPELARLPGVNRVLLAKPVRRTLDVSVASVHADGLRSRLGDVWSGRTGSGVVVGIVDSGVDVTHEDFRHPDGTTRVLSYWDQSDPTGPAPAGYGYGTEWTSADLDAGSRPRGDRVGHGTHVAGIAVGTGRAASVDSLRYRFAGLAPEADLVVVGADSILDTGVLDGVNYVFQVAEGLGKPAVVNLSLGSQFGPHDGTTPLELGIDALVGAGRLAVVAAGNEGDDRIHAELHVAGGGSDSTSLFLPYNYAPHPILSFVVVDCFYREPDSLSMTLVTPGGARFGPYRLGDTVTGLLTGEGTMSVTHLDSDPSTSNLQVQFDLSDYNPDTLSSPTVPLPASGAWTVVFADENGAPGGGEVDLWMVLTSIADFAGVGPIWIGDGYDPTEELSSPANAMRVVTVGSYNTKQCWPLFPDTVGCAKAPGDLGTPGKLTFFSSRGPTRDGRQKPEIVAPGFVVSSALSAQQSTEYHDLYGVDRTLDPDEKHFVFAGTSMSAPHVTGAVALLLENEPALTPETVQERLAASARQDSTTGPGWTPAGGFGKLDVAALVDSLVPVLVRDLSIQTTPLGRPRLEWEARSGDPVIAFLLESHGPEGAWRERGKFAGPGPHRWVDPAAHGTTTYRLEARLRSGETEVWAEARWEAPRNRRLHVGIPRPNPFPGRTRVPVSWVGAGNAEIDGIVLDATGRQVRRLNRVILDQTTGAWLEWDGQDDRGRPVAAGHYWIRVRSGQETQSIRVVRLP